jgi:phosphoglycolate phosphatase
LTRRFDLLVFDWDGTLADSEALIVGAMQAAIGDLKLPVRSDRQIRELIGLGLNEALASLYPEFDLPELLRLLEGYRARWVHSGLQEAPLFPGALESLRALHGAGYRLAVATGKSRRGLERSLATHAELRTLLCSSRCADETVSKPDPRMLHEILEEQAVDAGRALMVGDTDYDLIMARSAGMPAVAVACGVHPRERLVQAGARHILRDVTELSGWLHG